MNEQDIVAKLVRWQQRKFPLVEGRLNHHAYILLRAFNRYGVSRTAAERYIVGVLGHHCDLTDLRQLVANAYQHTDEHGTKVFDEQGRARAIPPPQAPTPLRSAQGFTLSPSQLARLAQWRQEDQQLRSAPRPVLPPPPSVTSTPTPAEGVTSSTAVTTPGPVTTSTDCKEQAGATPPSGTAAEAFNRWAALNPALNTLSQAFDLDLSRARFSTPPSEQVNRPRHERENCHAAIVLDLHRELPHLAPYTLALELFVRSGVNLSGQQVAKLLRDAGDQ